MKAASSGSKKRKSTNTLESPPLIIQYSLCELPSSQHRAGLAGLVLAVEWMRAQETCGGVCELSGLNGEGVTLRLDRTGLESLFDTIYQARTRLAERPSPFKKNGKTVPPKETKERVVVNKKGKETVKTVYLYPETVPDGAFLAAWDPSGDGNDGLWLKLWRDMLWQIVRGVPAQRKPFNDRAERIANKDASRLFSALRDPMAAVPQPSTYLIGAQETTADNIPFRDRARMQLLLHFWPFVAQVYKPVSVDREGKRVDHGYALAIPDVADLKLFCEELPYLLRERPHEKSGYLPRGAVVDLALESALSTMEQLERHLRNREGAKGVGDLVLGMDVVQSQKKGNNVRVLGQTRIEPRSDLAEYRRLREGYWSPLFRAQRIRNYLDGEVWHSGMDRVAALHSWKQTIDARDFRHDAREAFGQMEEQSDVGLEQLVLRVVNTYLTRKLASKYDLEWSKVKENDKKKKEYSERKAALARDAFLSVRSRTGNDFVQYFASTLCSVPQHLEDEKYLELSRLLLKNPEDARTLTLLALSAKA